MLCFKPPTHHGRGWRSSEWRPSECCAGSVPSRLCRGAVTQHADAPWPPVVALLPAQQQAAVSTAAPLPASHLHLLRPRCICGFAALLLG